MSKLLKVFITYSHQDTDAKDKLIECLAVMKQKDMITTWHDNEILPGDKWREAISNNLTDSDILLYLISASSLDSKNCNKELGDALDSKIRVIPIILESCDWQNHQLSDIQALPDKGKPINEWEPESKAWQNVVEGIRKVVDEMRDQPKHSPHTTTQEKTKILAYLALQRGNFLMMLKQIDRAIEVYSHAIQLDTHYVDAYINCGVAYGIKGELDQAIADYNKAIELNPDYATAYNNRGVVYSDKDEHDRAIVDYNKAIELDPQSPLAYSNRGIAYGAKSEHDRAIVDYNKAIELDPQFALAYSNRGIAYGIKGELDQAIEDFTKAIELNPQFALAYTKRSMCWLHLQNWREAKSDLIIAKNMGVDIIAVFRDYYRNVEAFERVIDVQLPEDIASMLTQRRRSRFYKTENFLKDDDTIPKPFESLDVLNLREKLRNAGTPLVQYVKIRPHFGIKTDRDDAFVVDSMTRDKLIEEHPSSADLLKPFLHGRDIRRWQVEVQDLWLIFAYRGIEINSYPAIQKHLEKYRDSLSERAGEQEWYELQVPFAASERFTQTKLVCPNLYNHKTFAVEADGFYCGHTCYLIPTEETWLCGVLNSRVVEWFYSQESNQLTGRELRALSSYMQQIPIPDITSAQKGLIGKIVDYLIYLQKQPTTNSKDLAYARDYVMLKYFERIIDGLAYESYLPEELHQSGKYFFKPLMDEQFPQTEEIQGDKISAFRDIFEHLYEKTYPVRKNLFFLDSLKPIRIIEGKV